MTKIEEVARAICCPSGCEWAPCLHDGDGEEPTAVRSMYLAKARAAIVALMEPSVSELARDLVMWHDMNGGVPTGKSLYDYFDGCGVNAPAWLREAITNDDRVPPKATRAAAIHRAMLQAALDEGKEGTS
jgi:hypothetical protein